MSLSNYRKASSRFDCTPENCISYNVGKKREIHLAIRSLTKEVI